MYGQMTAGSWIYIGTQGILQGTYECFAEIARRRFGGSLAGTITLTAGLGGMGGAQPLAITMNDGVALCIDVDPWRVERRIETRYLDEVADSASTTPSPAARPPATSAAACRSASSATPPTSCRGCSTSTSRPTSSPTRRAPTTRCRTCPSTSRRRPRPSWPAPIPTASSAGPASRWPRTARRWSGSSTAAPRSSTTATACAPRPSSAASTGRSPIPGFLPAYIRPLFCEGKGPFRWVALSGDPADIAATDRAVLEEFPDDDGLARWIRLAGERVAFQGLPARICWLGYGERHRLGLRFNEMVRRGEVSAPIVIGRDHLDSGSVASPYRETEAMADGSDAIADWPLLNALVNTSSGATWVSIHHGGGVGIGRSIHAGMVAVADGTDLAAAKLERVLTTDPGTGVIRHADAGYDRAVEVAAERGVRLPMTES